MGYKGNEATPVLLFRVLGSFGRLSPTGFKTITIKSILTHFTLCHCLTLNIVFHNASYIYIQINIRKIIIYGASRDMTLVSLD